MDQRDAHRHETYIEQLYAVWEFEEMLAEEQYRIEVLLSACQERGDSDGVNFLRQQLREMRIEQELFVRTSLDDLHRSFLAGRFAGM